MAAGPLSQRAEDTLPPIESVSSTPSSQGEIVASGGISVIVTFQNAYPGLYSPIRRTELLEISKHCSFRRYNLIRPLWLACSFCRSCIFSLPCILSDQSEIRSGRHR